MKIRHEQICCDFREDGVAVFDTEFADNRFPSPLPNVRLSLWANPEAEIESARHMNTDDFFVFRDHKKVKNGVNTRLSVSNCALEITEKFRFTKGCNVIAQTNVLHNYGKKNIVVTECSSANIGFIGWGDASQWAKKGRIKVYYAISRWQGEAQWQCASLEELGVYPCSSHKWDKVEWSIRSSSSWSTGTYLPLVIVEDRLLHKSWFVELEEAVSWKISVTSFGGRNSRFIYLSAGQTDESGGWKYKLKPGGRYETPPVAFGAVRGGFSEAVAELVKFKRAAARRLPYAPLVFNDFMNCTWGIRRESLRALIDKAAEAGAEYFCIDGGWAENGLWTSKKDFFDGKGLQAAIDYIKAKNMKAGLWFEFEATCSAAAEKFGDKNRYLKRNGKIFPHYLPKLNMRNKKAEDFLEKCVDYYYSMGIRYIKNDHNCSDGFGIDMYGDSPAEGTRKNMRAFYRLIEKIRGKYPDLVLENCASGAMRADNGTLRLFDLQSTSDQEDYRAYPSIATGSYAYLLPEKAGIWAYPYPLEHKYLQSDIPEEDLLSMQDGRQTVFNMVTGLSGTLYLSGRIDLADEYNFSLIKEGAALYKETREFKSRAYPVFFHEHKKMSDDSFILYGLRDENFSEMYLYVWLFNEKKIKTKIGKYENCKLIYPSSCNYLSYSYEDGLLRVETEKPYSACVLKLY